MATLFFSTGKEEAFPTILMSINCVKHQNVTRSLSFSDAMRCDVGTVNTFLCEKSQFRLLTPFQITLHIPSKLNNDGTFCNVFLLASIKQTITAVKNKHCICIHHVDGGLIS